MLGLLGKQAALQGGYDAVALLKRKLQLEDIWWVRGYQHCGLLMLGEADSAGSVRRMRAHEQFPTTAAAIARLWSGERGELDMLLREETLRSGELEPLLRELRLMEVLRDVLPQLPPYDWQADKALRRFQLEHIIRWYQLHRPRLRFDRSKHRWEVPPNNSDVSGRERKDKNRDERLAAVAPP